MFAARLERKNNIQHKLIFVLKFIFSGDTDSVYK